MSDERLGPTFLILGAAKSGTTTLYEHLRAHPQVFVSPVKEPRFFAIEGRDPAELTHLPHHLVTRWDDAVADRIAAENLYLDVSKDRRRAAIESLRAKVGECRTAGPFDVENALRGQWTLSCERGDLRVAITLAPSMPPLVQHLAVDLVDPTRPVSTGACPATPATR